MGDGDHASGSPQDLSVAVEIAGHEEDGDLQRTHGAR